MRKKLYKSRYNRWIFGVCGGLGEYFNISPTIIRIIFFVLSSFTRVLPAAILYIILSIVIPSRSIAQEWQEQVNAYNQDMNTRENKTSVEDRFDEFESFDDIRRNADVVENISEVKRDVE